MLRKLAFAIAYLILITGVFHAFQNKAVYNHTLAKISTQYSGLSGQRVIHNKPFQEITHNNLINWDGYHYYIIKDHLYTQENIHSYAFFPLFPLVWKATNFSSITLSLLNYFAFVVGLLLLCKLTALMGYSINNNQFLLALSFPLLAIMLIPYSEALSFVLLSAALFFYYRGKYRYYFLLMFLAALNRSAIQIVGLSLLVAEVYLLLFHRQWKDAAIRLGKNLAPILLGIACVTVFQNMLTGKSGLLFIEAQEKWDTKFRLPTQLTDWSLESFGLNYISLWLVLGPLSVFVFWYSIKNMRAKHASFSKSTFLLFTSVAYLLGSFFYVIFTRGGSLHNLSRFTLATPFFFILLFVGQRALAQKINLNIQALTVLSFSIIAFLMIYSHPTFEHINFSHAGFFLLPANYMLWIYATNKPNTPLYQIGLYLYLFMNAVWTCYLINLYMIDSWIWA